MDAEKIPVERVVVITDDLNLPFGTLRLRAKGSDGGHNGLKDIQAVLGTTVYPRLRFGIGAEFGKGQQIDYVLGTWSSDEQARMDERLTKAGDAVLNITTAGLARAMNTYNGQ
jgi:PTH1 family peptidyl-tRNA hydrolase